MNVPIKSTHSPFGGSVAARVLCCTASVKLVEQVPECLREVSAYAAHGTALHAAMTLLIDGTSSFEDLVGKVINGCTISRDDVENSLRPVYAYVDALLNTANAEFYLEQRVTFPTIPGAFGTADLIVRVGKTIHVIDFKFGVGVRVLALYPEGDEDIVNSQLLFYAAAARNSFPGFFAGINQIVLTILQPQSIEPDAELESSVTVTPAELDAFVAAYRLVCEEALSPEPRLQAGAHYRFCPARPICPKHTKPLLDLSQFVVPTPPRLMNPFGKPTAPDDYLRVLAAGLDLVDAIKELSVELRAQAKRALESGNQVPGYALSSGRAERHWRDETTAIGALVRLGLNRDDLIVETLRSAEMRAKAHSLKVPADLILSRRSGVSLVKEENIRERVLSRDELVRSFSKALEAFQNSH